MKLCPVGMMMDDYRRPGDLFAPLSSLKVFVGMHGDTEVVVVILMIMIGTPSGRQAMPWIKADNERFGHLKVRTLFWVRFL